MSPPYPKAADGPHPEPQGPPFPVVAIGGGAGAHQAIEEVLKSLRSDRLAVFVLMQNPGLADEVAGQLRPRIGRPVVVAGDGEPVRPGALYVVRGSQALENRDGALVLAGGAEAEEKPPVLDLFFRALARAQGSAAIAVVLSGAGTDGTLGMKEVKAGGGITFVQDPASAEVPEQPQSGLEAGFADFALAPPQIGEELTRISGHAYVGPERSPSREGKEVLAALLQMLRSTYKLDFTDYKADTLERRIDRRMALHRLDRREDYLRLVQGSEGELGQLYRDLLIKVTSFFRDREPFERLKGDVLGRILDSRPRTAPIRVWVPGCATGEEAYSIAITLLEVLGDRASDHRVQVFATDVDAGAIAAARQGIFPPSIELDVSADRLARFFTRRDRSYQIGKQVRDLVIFAAHNLTGDPPFSRIDLVSCRNVLIYMQPALQRRVLRIFHHALNPGGWLLLGSSEAVGEVSGLYTQVDRKAKLYLKRTIATSTAFEPKAEPVAEEPPAPTPPSAADSSGRHGRVTMQQLADRKVLERYGPPGVLVNENLEVLQFRGKVGQFLEPVAGSATLHLLKLARPELVNGLRTAVARCFAEASHVRADPIRYRDGEVAHEVTIEVLPVPDPGSQAHSALVLFDAGAGPRGRRPAPRGKGRVAELERELGSTKEYLQSVIAEQQSYNEQMQGANEELQSANEELQSTNEELQTSREELQSANEELATINEELQHRMAEVGLVKDDLHNVLEGVSAGVVLVTLELRVRFLSPAACALLSVSDRDVGRPLAHLFASKADGAALEKAVWDCIQSLRPTEQDHESADGKRYRLRVAPYRSSGHAIKGAVLSFLPTR